MSQASLEHLGEGNFRVVGDLDYETVTELLDVDDTLFAQGPGKIEVDLAGVGRTTSVGLALMLEWVRMARTKDKSIRFNNVPDQMLGMAIVSQLESILQLETPAPAAAEINENKT